MKVVVCPRCGEQIPWEDYQLIAALKHYYLRCRPRDG